MITDLSKTILAVVITVILMITVVVPGLRTMLTNTMENMRNIEIISTSN